MVKFLRRFFGRQSVRPVRRNTPLLVEPLESRDLLAVYFWNPPGVDGDWSKAGPNGNWTLNFFNGARAAVAPGPSDDVYMTSVKNCKLDVPAVVNRLEISPQNGLMSFTFTFGPHTLRVQSANAATSGFRFDAGCVYMSDDLSRLEVSGLVGCSWTKGIFLGGRGSFEIKDGSFVSVVGFGQRTAETTILIDSDVPGLTSVLEVATFASGWIDRGHVGRINVGQFGALVLNNEFSFSIRAEAENPYPLDVDGRLSQNWIGITTIQTEVLLDAPTSSLFVNAGKLVVDDVNQLASVTQYAGQTRLSPNAHLEVKQGFRVYDGYFALDGVGAGPGRDIFFTEGDFYFEGGSVSLVRNIASQRGLVWSADAGEVIFGDGSSLSLTISVTENRCDLIGAVDLHFSELSELLVSSDGFIPPGSTIIPISAEFSLTGLPGTMFLDGEALQSYLEVDVWASETGYTHLRFKKPLDGGGGGINP